MQQTATLRRPAPVLRHTGSVSALSRKRPERVEIEVEIVDGAHLTALVDDWQDLIARADVANVFMDPRVLSAAAAQTRVTVLLAWSMREQKRRLVGIWGFSAARPRRSVLPITVLRAPAAEHAYLASPVIDRGCLEEALEAMLEAAARAPGLPKFMTLDAMRTEGATFGALVRVLALRGTRLCAFDPVQRPILASDLLGDAYLQKALSGSSRKKLRQYRRRLGEKGRLETRTLRASEDVRRAFEDFLALEAVGWKGRRGSALLSSAADAAFARIMVGRLAEIGNVSVHTLELDGRPVSMQIVLYAGSAAFTWKTAYDETLADVSPGTLLFEDYTKGFLADAAVASVDSCSHDDGGYMGAWMEREALADVWLDVRRGGSVLFLLVTVTEGACRAVRWQMKHIYLRSRVLQRLREAAAKMRQWMPRRHVGAARVD
jgi:CelD/BcsL family acetyltransferase involved in cellulose biosynthesis